MRWYLSVAMAVALVAGPARAHFVFVVPQKDGTSVKVVFSDSLEPDENVDIAKIAGLKLTGRYDGGKHAPIECKKGEHCLTGTLGLVDPRVVFGSLDYGVIQRGEAKPFLLKYHPKAVFAGTDTRAATLGEAADLEIVPVTESGKTRFRLLAKGKPVADAEGGVLLPDGKKEKVNTDADGYTPAFTQTGRYAAYLRLTEAKAGEHDGKKYEEVRHYATLVVDVAR